MKDTKNVNTVERITVSHTTGEVGRESHCSLVSPEDVTVFHFNRPPVARISPGADAADSQQLQQYGNKTTGSLGSELVEHLS